MSNVTGDGGSFSSANTTDEANFNCSTSEKHLKKKRNLPGTPDPTADVIALSPTTLVATNRFVCEVCNKGFQRDQNLQLHRRGHNLPWKLRQRSTSEVKKRVYICPEPTCVHHNPGRALGDLTGIKKHFFRKHGEKKWKCEKCSKKYAVQSDWKAHSKICGTREYKCDCGTIFSRRDSFITHRAFCDALAEENNKANQLGMINPLGGNYQNQNPINMNTQKQSVEVPNFNPNTKESLNFCSQQKRPIPLKTLNMSGSMLSNPSLFSPRGLSSSSSSSSSFGGLYNASQSQISATALLQKAAQMTSNPSFVSLIASQDQLLDMGSYGGLEGTGFTASQLVQQDVPELSSQMFGTSVESQGNVTNDTSIFGNTSVFIGDQGQQRVNAFQGRHYNRGPKDYTNNHQCISGFSGGDVMTVDFLGVGGPQTVNLQEPQASQQNNIGFEEPQRFHVLDPFQQPSTSNKGIWDI